MTPFSYLLIAARGSSDNAALFFQYFVGQRLSKVVALATPSLYEHSEIDLSDAVVVAISQSGRSPGIADVAEQARRQGRTAVAITNDISSPLALSSDFTLQLATGPERAIASTKTFSATWQALSQLLEAMSGTELEGLDALPDVIDATVQWALNNDLALDLIDVARGITVVGRGIGAAVADEIALKIREVSGIRAESYAVADYLHGPIGADGDGCTMILVVTDEISDEVAHAAISGSREASMRCVVLRSPSRYIAGADAEVVVPHDSPNWLAGLALVVVGQVLALRLGERHGRPIDTSPRLKKVTLSA
jgi:glucosamine--fructose-6-phosphate aminotransferase (isomerizing)